MRCNEKPAEQRSKPRLVVGVGGSGGDLEAFCELLRGLPVDGDMAFVLVAPPDAVHEGLLVEQLGPSTSMPMVVVEASKAAREPAEVELQANAVYIASPGTVLCEHDGALVLAPPSQDDRRPIDLLFASLARVLGSNAAAIVLSGTGTGGSAGVRDLRAVGGLTIAQVPSTARLADMPQSAIDIGGVELVLPVSDMPAALRRFDRLPASTRVEPQPPEDSEDDARTLSEHQLARLAASIDPEAEFDLRAYKLGTIERRLLRRMSLTGYSDVETYLGHLHDDRAEQRALAREMLISVTEFYRDPEVFEALCTLVVEPLVDAMPSGGTLRVWVPGCATGEEAYSIAIEVLEVIEHRAKPVSLQLFATDVDPSALSVARVGLYPATIAEQVGRERLEKYFDLLDGGGYQVGSRVRDTVSFAVHDLTRDPPFSRMGLVSCRNVLIYLRPTAQEHVLSLLHFSLQPEGYLLLGTSGSVGPRRHLYATLSKKWRIFRKMGVSEPLALRRRGVRPLALRHEAPESRAAARSQLRAPTRRRRGAVGDDIRHAVMQARVPPTIVVDEHGAVLFMHGELRPYLRFPDGDPHFELTSLVTPELVTRVRAALYKCRRDGHTQAAYSSPDVEGAGRTKITATPAPELGNGVVILTFEVAPEAALPSPSSPESAAQDALIEQLEEELLAIREDLCSTVEELEFSSEELRCSNEQATTMNEELQSANEELEVTSEELRALNDELTVVNAQLREKVELLEQAHDDLANFFESAKIATVFLDERLRIKRFTPAAEELVRIDQGDVGRHVGDIARELLHGDLQQEAQQVLVHLDSQTRELQLADGRWISRRVLPYRTQGQRIEGVVVTFVDVSDLKRTAERLSVRERQQAVIARLGMRALEEPELQIFFDQAVREIQQTLESDCCKILELQPGGEVLLLRAGVGWREGLVGQATVGSDLDSQAGYTLRTTAPVLVDDLEHERRFSGPSLLIEHEIRSGLSCVIRGVEEAYGVLGVHTRRERKFTPEDAHFLQAAASVIAGAIHRQETHARLELEGAVAKALAESDDVQDVVAAFHAAAFEALGVEVVELWEPSSDGQALERTAVYAASSSLARQVEQKLSPTRLALSEGLPSRVHLQRRALWVTSLQDPRWFSRVELARRLGLRSGLALPILSGNEALGVVTCLSSGRLHADGVFLRSLEGIGRAIGDFVQRLAVERRFRSTIEGAPVGIADRALDGRCLRANPRLCEIVGRSAEELIGRSFMDITHPDDIERETELHAAIKQGRSHGYEIEKRYVRKDGTTVWVSVVSSLITKPSGEPDYLVNVIEDISARRHAEDELRRSEARFRQVLVSSPVPMMVHDDRGRILALSNSWTDVTGYTREDIPTRTEWIRKAFRERAAELEAQSAELWANAMAERNYELELWTKSDERKTLLFKAVPLGTTSTGRRLRLVSAMDITQQRRFERELLEASRQKDEFIAMMGHELRNPLAAVSSAAEILRQPEPGPELLGRVLAILERQTVHMAKLLDGLLDVSRVVRGHIKVDRQTIDLRRIVRDVVGDFASRSITKGLELRAELASEPLWAEVDVVRLTQIVDNLLSNAVKYTPAPGTITVRLEADDGAAVLTVRDTGDGIDPEFLPYLFEPFRQARQSLDRAQGGIGIGLALVKRLVELHDGTVVAHSDGVGRGAALEVRLPLASQPAQAPRSRSGAASPRRILLIEDNEDAAEMLRTVLELRGHEVRVALHGTTGIELARELRPQVVICDLGLPDGVTGFHVAQALREDPRTQAIGLIALSGYAREEDQQRSRAAGFDAHLAKPVSLEQIDGVLDRFDATDEPGG